MANSCHGLAHLRQHKRSPFWYLRSRSLDTGIWGEKSTSLRVDSQSETRAAQRMADKKSAEERRVGAPGTSPAFLAWVPGYLSTHGRRYRIAWYPLRTFLAVRDIVYPRQIKYWHGADYIAWRINNPVNGKAVGHNSALLEIKFLAQLMNEAVRREFTESNPLARLGIGRQASKVKPELTDKQIQQLRTALKNEPEWMRTAFEISLYTGCRFNECEILMANVDLRAGTIRLCDSKRRDTDPRKYFTVPIHPNLRPLLRSLKKRGAKVTCRLSQDKNGRINYLFRRIGIQASFHSLRVTFVTRCHRGELTDSEAMRLVNHSSQLVHRVYSRLNVEDVRRVQRKIPLP